MKTIKLGFSKPTDMTLKVFAWAIMKAYNINYDHCYIRMNLDSFDREVIYQASGMAVNFMSAEIFASKNTVILEHEITMSDETYKALMQFCIDNCGKPYGIKDILGLAWVRINYWCGRTIQNPFNDGGATYVCSELAATILRDFDGVTLPANPDDMTPLDVYNLVQLLNKKV